MVEHWDSTTCTKYLTTLDRLEDNPEESAQAAVFCYLWITGYYQSQSEAVEALNFESGSCSRSNTAAAAYEEDTPDDLK